jgi:hypothetical protein
MAASIAARRGPNGDNDAGEGDSSVAEANDSSANSATATSTKDRRDILVLFFLTKSETTYGAVATQSEHSNTNKDE